MQFQDDGGTAMWRARQHLSGRVINASPLRKRLPFWPTIWAIFITGLILPWFVLIGGLVLLGIWDHVVG